MCAAYESPQLFMPKPIGEIFLTDNSVDIKYTFDPPYRGITRANLRLYVPSKDERKIELHIDFEAVCPKNASPLRFSVVERNRGLANTVSDWSLNPSVLRLSAEGYVDLAYLRNPSKQP